MATKTLTALVQSFFTVALPQRNASPQTILSYRDALKLLLSFISERKRRPVIRLKVADLDVTSVSAFLDHLEKGRGNQISTRNNRLAALRSFFGYVATQAPELADHCHRVCAIPLKRAPERLIIYLEHDEVQALLAAPNTSTPAGRRDHALLLFLYNTGARVRELTGVTARDLQLFRPYQTLLRGKGTKERICPLWKATTSALHDLLDEAGIQPGSDRRIFLNNKGQPLSRFGVAYILKKHVVTAAAGTASLVRKRVSPHTFRHTTAVHLLSAGVDINVIRSWLGHVDLKTTNVYAQVDLATKRKAIEACAPPTKKGRRRPSWKRKPDLLAWLEDL